MEDEMTKQELKETAEKWMDEGVPTGKEKSSWEQRLNDEKGLTAPTDLKSVFALRVFLQVGAMPQEVFSMWFC